MMHQSILPASVTVEEYFRWSRFACAQEQRDYQWLPEQVGDLLRDVHRHGAVQAATTPPLPYFLGTIVLRREGETFLIYDGLQRTTTLTLLLCLLRDRIDEPGLKARLQACVAGEDGAPRLVLPPPDDTLQQRIQPIGATIDWGRGGRQFGRGLALLRNRKAALRRLDRLDAAGRRRLAETLLGETVLVVLQIGDRRLAPVVFDRINSTGTPLQPHDLIKSRLLQFARDPQDGAKLVEMWEAVRQPVMRDFGAFVGDILVCAQPHTPPLPPDRLVERFIDWAAQAHWTSPQGLYPWLRHATRDARDWNAINRVATTGYTPRVALRPLLPVWAVETYDWRPLALAIHQRANKHADGARTHRSGRRQAKEDIAASMHLLQLRAMAVQLARTSQANRVERFRKAITALRRGEDVFEGTLRISDPMRNRIRATLRTPMSDTTLRRNLLKWVNAQGRERIDHLSATGDAMATVEHVLPQNAGKDSPWLADFPDFDERHRLTNMIGNFVLVPEWLNKLLANRSFEEKRALIGQHADRLGNFPRALALLEHEEWTPDVIRKRTDAFGAEIWALLELPGDPEFLVPLVDDDPAEDEGDPSMNEPDEPFFDDEAPGPAH